MTELEQAIKDMQEGRQSHVEWAEHLEAGGCEKCNHSLTGDAEHNREWVKKYDNAIKILESLRTSPPVSQDLLTEIYSLLSWVAHRGWRVYLEEDQRLIKDRLLPELERLRKQTG